MRPLLIAGGLTAALLAGAAQGAAAADMAPAPVLRGVLPASEPGQDWSGFYVGGFGGYNQMNFEPNNAMGGLIRNMLRSTVWLNPGVADDIVVQRRVTSNAIGYGAFVGYNWAMEDFVVGVEADYTRAKLDGTANGGRSGAFGVPDISTVPRTEYRYVTTASSQLKVTDMGTVRARFGVPYGNVMPFVTAGVSWARLSYGNRAALTGEGRSVTDVGGVVTFGPWGPAGNHALQDGSRTRFSFGYALGAGADWAITQNILLRAELMHVRIGNAGDTNVTVNTARAGAAVKF